MGGAAVIDAAKVIAAIAYADKDPHKAAERLLAAASKPRYFLLQLSTRVYTGSSA